MEKPTDNKTVKWVQVIIVASLVAMLLFAVLSYAGMRDAIISQIQRNSLELVHTFRAHATLKSGDNYPGEIIQNLRRLWQLSESSFNGAYLSVVDRSGRLLLHTLDPGKQGMDIGNRAMHSENTLTLNELLSNRQDYSGPYQSLSGQQELAAFTFVPIVDALISIHIPYHVVQDRLYQSGWQWFIAMMLVGVGLLLLMLVFRKRFSMLLTNFAKSDRQQLQPEALNNDHMHTLEAKNKQVNQYYQAMQTKEKQYRSQLQSEKAAAEKASRHKTEFLFRLNHELRTPLHAIVGFTQLLQQTPLNADQKENLDEIYVAGQYLQKLVSDVLELSIIESGRMEMSLKPVAIDELSDECIKMLGPLADARNIRLHAHNDRSGKYWVDADRTRLQQVIINLLGNAIEYSREGGDVSVEIHGYTRRVVYLVRDTGPGLNRQQLEELFIPLPHQHSEPGNKESTGIGLAICHALVEQMNGKIKVTSVPDIGSVFQLEFPLSVIHSDTENIQKIIDIKTPGYNEGREFTLLYVDDNGSNLGFMRQLIMNRPELHFIATTDPEQCLDLVQMYNPDIIVLDLHMEEARARKLFVQLRSNPMATAIPIVAINANIHSVTKADMENMQFKACCAEPLDAEEFNQALDQVLSGAQ